MKDRFLVLVSSSVSLWDRSLIVFKLDFSDNFQAENVYLNFYHSYIKLNKEKQFSCEFMFKNKNTYKI